jgi:phosphate:Na+ symporter
MIGLVATILAGLGFVFIGLRFIADNLQQASGRNMRRVIARYTGTALRGGLAGTVAGALMQSSNAVTLIAGNMVQTRLLGPAQALPVVAGANIGTALIVFVAAIDIRLFIFYLIGLIGLGFHFNLGRSPAVRHLMGAALGAAMLFLGLDLIKSLPQAIAAADLGFGAADIAGGHVPPLLGFFAGLVGAMITQSSSTPTIIVVAAIGSGLLGLDESLPIVLGANLGSGLSTLLAGRSLAGSARQLCIGHIAVKAAGTLAVGAILVGYGALPSFLHGFSAETDLALVFLAMQLLGTAAVMLVRRPLARFAHHLSPPTPAQSAATPAFIYDGALEEAGTALDLAERELARLVAALPERLPDLDHSPAERRAGRAAAAARALGGATLARELESFVATLIERGASGPDLADALTLQARIGHLRSLQETLDQLAAIIERHDSPPQLAFSLSESLRMILLTLAEAAENQEELALLATLTADRSALLDRIRHGLMSQGDAPVEIQRDLFQATGLFERALWIVRRLLPAAAPRAPEETEAVPSAVRG